MCNSEEKDKTFIHLSEVNSPYMTQYKMGQYLPNCAPAAMYMCEKPETSDWNTVELNGKTVRHRITQARNLVQLLQRTKVVEQ